MKKIIESYNEFIQKQKINEISFNAKEVDYEIIDNKDTIEYIVKNDNDVLTVKFTSIVKDVYERIYKINERTTKVSNNDTPFFKNIIKYVSFITREFITKYSPKVLMLIHMVDAMLSSEKRMKLNKLYLPNIISDSEYKYEIKRNDNDYVTFLYNDALKYKEFINLFLDEIDLKIVEELDFKNKKTDYNYSYKNLVHSYKFSMYNLEIEVTFEDYGYGLYEGLI
jgi:hypothetical protein